MNITKEEYEALPEGMKAKFSATDSGDYSNGEEEASALKNALDRVREEKKEALAKIAEGEEATSKAVEAAKAQALKDARESGDIKALEKSWAEKAQLAEDRANQMENQINQGKIDLIMSKSLEEIGSISTSPDAMKMIAKGRIQIDMVDGVGIPRVLDKDGKPSALSIDDLKKEYLDDAGLKGMIKGGLASGGGASNNSSGGAAQKKLSEMDADEAVAFKKESPDQYAAQVQ